MMSNQPTKSIIKIGDMACSGCADTVQQALIDVEGVQKAAVDLDNESALVLYDAGQASTKNFKQAVENSGYTFNGIKNQE